MSGDYSRKTFNPRRDFSGVLMQQGRVQLDADWNELVGIISRRLRAETTDIIGRGTVPKETPDGFNIQIAGGTLTIGRGRIYVDGLLAENHGKEPLEFDPVLAEQRGTLAVPYNEQPYFPNVALVAPAPQEGGPYLVYLDVWQREVTFLEDPDLIEKALGVDTTTRLQTVWQVRVLSGVGANVGCDTPDAKVPGWPEIIRPSDGRLTTDAVGVASDVDPCVIPPSGGYRGLENRLYRVEIHDGGVAGKATFKWSRDNASIATSVTAITALDKLTVARIGRDATLRFSVGDWIEITDDWLEFAQQPDLIRQIQDVDDATQIITLTSALPAGIFPDDGQGNLDPKRHTRIRRWDQHGKVADTNGSLLVDLDAPGSDGLIPIPPGGTSVVLEDGVQITFDTPASGAYRVGDYWSFAARTADASVEKLVQAPPCGIHHHFCRLAMVTFPNPPTDCRHLWPPDFGDAGCDCSVCVTADSHNQGTLTIQHAIDQVKTIGGTVCLGVGIYNLGENPINITGAKSLRVRGQGMQTALTYIGAGSAILIEGSSGVTVEQLALLTAAREKTTSPAVTVHNSSATTLQRNAILRVGVNELATAAIGLGGTLVGVLIRENFLVAPIGIGRLAVATATGLKRTTKAAAAAALDVALLTADLVVQDNTLECGRRGISFDGVSIHGFQTRLAGNLIVGCSQAGIMMLGWVVPGSGLDVRENEIHVTGSGIIIGTDDARIESNNIAPQQFGKGGDGIILTLGFDKTGLDRCQILNNRILGLAGNGIHIVNGIIRSAMIKNNFIEAVGGGGIVMDDKSTAGQMTIENNQLLNLAPLANDAKVAVIGLRVVNTLRAEIVGNALIGVGLAAAQSPRRAGIQVANIGSGRISGNEVLNVGPPGDFLQETVGIDCLGTFARLDITDNVVRRNAVLPTNPGTSRWFAVHIGALARNGFVAVSTNLSLMAVGELIYVFAGDKLTALPRGKEIVGLQGNLLEGYGAASVVSVVASGALTLSTNRCLLSTAAATGANFSQPVAQAQAGAVIASANYLEGPAKLTAMVLKLPQNGPFTVLGNISSGNILVNGNALAGTTWGPFNIVAA
jgi:Family of unknown function (DUF6519)/Right handed beta helix region